MTTQQQEGLFPEFTTGDRLRKAREMRGLEQGPFAKLIGVSRGTVSNYERETVDKFRPIVMRAWAFATGVDLTWLETGQGSASPGGPGGGKGADTSARVAKLAATKRSATRPRTTAGYPALATAA